MGKLAKVTGCEECPVYKTGKGRCLHGGASTDVDVYVLGGAPTLQITQGSYEAFTDDAGFMYRNILAAVKKQDNNFRNIKLKFHHAAHCFDPKMNTKVIQHCSQFVKHDIYYSNPKVVLALGAEAMKALDLQGTVSALRGQEHTLYLNDKEIPAICSFAPGALKRKENTGKLPSAQNDIRSAFKVASFGKRKHVPIEELTKDYLICKTPAEFKYMVDQALAHPADTTDGSVGTPEQNLLAMDVETAVEGNRYSAVNTWVPGFKMIALSVSWGPGKSGAVLLDHRENPYDYADFEEQLKRLLESPNPKTFHNWKYECKVLENAYGYKVNNVKFDSQMGEYLLFENKVGEYGLKDITKYRVPAFYGYEKMLKSPMHDAKTLIEDSKETLVTLQEKVKESTAQAKQLRFLLKDTNTKLKLLNKKNKEDLSKIEELEVQKQEYKKELEKAKKTKQELSDEVKRLKDSTTNAKEVVASQKEMSFEDMDMHTMLLYNAIDSDVTRQITKQQVAEIKAESPALFNVLVNVMLPATRVLAEMEHIGMKVDQEYLTELEEHFDEVINSTRHSVFSAIGHEINLNSSRALIDVLTVNYGVQLTKKTKGGQYSTDSSVMEELAEQYPIAKMILEYKQAYKARHTFLKGILLGGKSPHDYGCSIDGRIHTNFNQTVASTGRLCIAKGSLVKVVGRDLTKYPQGIPIEMVRERDDVYAFTDDNTLTIQPVTWSGITGVKQKVIRVHWGTSSGKGYLDVTPEHKFRVLSGGYQEAQNLKPGTHLVGIECPSVEKVEDLGKRVDVYCLEVAETHNFICNEVCVKNSSASPNMQNLPAYILGKNIKKIFIPDNPETQCIVQVDYSAAEIRVLVAYAPDANLIKVLNSGLCMHSYVASKVFGKQGIFNTPGVTYEQVKNREELMESDPKEYKRLNTMRQISKMVVFLTIYGGTEFTLKSNLENSGISLSEEECKSIIDSLLSEFPAIKVYMKNIKRLVDTKGEVSTHFGRKRRFPIARFDFKLKKAAYREAINAPIQGTSSDIVLHQMEELWQKFNDLGYKNVMRGTVHDSMFFQFEKSELHKLMPLLTTHVRDNVNKHFNWMPVKFEFDAEYGPSYGEAKTRLK